MSFILNWKFLSYATDGISWLCLIILVCPAIVPSTPRSTFVPHRG